MKPKVYLLSITLLALVLYQISYSQNKEVPFALSPFIGDTLNLAERNYYELYQDFSGFQQAVYSISEDGATLFTKISYSGEGEEKDTVIKQNADYKGNLLALIRRVDDERMENWEDAREITLTDLKGNRYTGSFFSLEKDRLYMTTAQFTDYSQVINKYRIFNRYDVESILIKGKNRNLGLKVGYGFLGGAAFGILLGLGASLNNNSSETPVPAGLLAEIFGAAFGAVGAVVGLVVSLSVPTSDEMIKITNDEDFKSLARFLGSKNINRQVYIIDQ